jgi:hypothetical protein
MDRDRPISTQGERSMTTLQTRFLSVFLAAAAALGSAATSSEARSVLPHIGRGFDAFGEDCFSVVWDGTITNIGGSCGREYFHIPIVTDGTFDGWHNFTINAYGADTSHNVGCGALSISSNGAFWSWSGEQWLSTFGVTANLYRSVHVPGGGGVHVRCQVDPGAKINLVNF